MACITVGVLFRWWKAGKEDVNRNKRKNTFNYSNSNKYVDISNLGEVLAKSIIDSINTLLLIGGFIILFSVIISILENSKILFIFSNILSPIFNLLNVPNTYVTGIISGIIELTNGVNMISSVLSKSLSLNIVICAFLIGFGGISVLLQVLSITSKSKISIKPYIYGKLLQGAFATFYTFLILKYSIFFSLNL